MVKREIRNRPPSSRLSTVYVLSRGRVKAALQYGPADSIKAVEMNDFTIFPIFRSDFDLQQVSKACGSSKTTYIDVKEETGAWTSGDAAARREQSWN